MESLSDILERPDVKAYVNSYKLRIQGTISQRLTDKIKFSLINFAFYQGFHLKLSHLLQKKYNITSDEIYIVIAAYHYSWSKELNGKWSADELYDIFFADTIKVLRFKKL